MLYKHLLVNVRIGLGTWWSRGKTLASRADEGCEYDPGWIQ